MTDPVNHPAHYTEHPSGIECIQITEHMGFNLGNAVKYIWRADLKGSAIEDLEKARWYIDRELVKRGVATEPAVERCQSVSIFRERCALVPGHGGRHAANGCAWGYPPTPAEPAEEETKAEPWIVQLPEGMTMEQWIESLPDEAPGLLAAVREVRERLGISSPVVPAPTETGPWETVDEIPGSVTRIKDCEGDVWHRCTAGWEHGGLHGPEGYAPFVAAEEGRA